MSHSMLKAELGLPFTFSESRCHVLCPRPQQPPTVSVCDLYVCEEGERLPLPSARLPPHISVRRGVLSHFSRREGNRVPTTRGPFPLHCARFTTALTSLLPFPFPGSSQFIFGQGEHQQRFLSK